MTKKVKISLLMLVWSIVAVQMYVNYCDSKAYSEQVVTAFSVVNENVTSETINGYGFFGSMDLTKEMKKNMLQNLALKLGIEDGYTFSEGKGDGFAKISLEKKGKYATTFLRVITIYGEGEPEQHITVQIETASDIKDAYSLYEKTKQVFDEIGVEAQVSMEVEMEREGNVWEDEGKTFVDTIFDAIEAKTVDIIDENDLCTVYGYTKQESSYLNLNHKKVNVQVVMTFDESRSKTYIKIGLPIVNSSY